MDFYKHTAYKRIETHVLGKTKYMVRRLYY